MLRSKKARRRLLAATWAIPALWAALVESIWLTIPANACGTYALAVVLGVPVLTAPFVWLASFVCSYLSVFQNTTPSSSELQMLQSNVPGEMVAYLSGLFAFPITATLVVIGQIVRP